MQLFRATIVLTSSLIVAGVLLAGGAGLASQTATGSAAPATALPDAEDLVVGAAGLGLAAVGCWLILVTLACARELALGRALPPTGPTRSAALHRALLRACVPTVSAAALCVPQPATADLGSPENPGALQGLPLPERPVLTAPDEAAADREPLPALPRVRTVLPGDSLWAIAADLLGPDPADAEVDRGWRALHRLNRDRVGRDPDLIVPGTRLRVPVSLPRPRHQSR